MPPYPVVVNVVKLRQKTLLASEPSSPNSIPLNAPSIDKPKNVNTQQIRLNQQIDQHGADDPVVADVAPAEHRSRDHDAECRRDRQPGRGRDMQIVRPRIAIALEED